MNRMIIELDEQKIKTQQDLTKGSVQEANVGCTDNKQSHGVSP